MENAMENKEEEKETNNSEISITRRSVLGAGAVIAGAGVLGSKLIDPIAKTAHAAGSDNPIKIGFQAHRTGIGTVYGKWYERTTNAAAKYINKTGGIAGRPVEIITEEFTKEENKLKIKTKVVDPIFVYVVNKIYPYIIVSSIIFVLTFIIALLLLFLIIKNSIT